MIEDENNGMDGSNGIRVDSLNEDRLYSLRDMINDTHNFNSQNIFQIIYQGRQCQIMKHVHFKIKKDFSSTQPIITAENKVLVQVIDVSDRILYKEIKADKLVLTLVNGVVSHELRNPVNAL